MNAQSPAPTDAPAPAPADPGGDDFFDSSGHLRILRHLEQAMAQDDRLVVLTGDKGVGKTTVVQRLLRDFDPGAIWCVQLSAKHLDTGELPGSLARAFGAPAGVAPAEQLHAALHQHLAAHADGRMVLAVIDDAHALAPEAITELNEQAREGPLRVLLVGRPALRTTLAALPLPPASLSCHLEPLLETETPVYIAHHLRRVGWNGKPEFSAEARTLVHRFSRGVPLRIDRLCTQLLEAAREREERTITSEAVRRVAQPQLDENAIPMLTSAVDEPLSSGWAATSGLPPDSELPAWARAAAEPDAAADAGAAVTVRRRRIGLAVSAAVVVAAVVAVWAYRTSVPRGMDALLTLPPVVAPPAPALPQTPPAQAPPEAAAPPAPAVPTPTPPAPAPASAEKRPAAVAATPPRPPAAPPQRAGATAPPTTRAGTPAAAPPPPVPGPCTANVAALGLCTPTEKPP